MDQPNILGLICFSLFFGFGLRRVNQVDGVGCLSVLLSPAVMGVCCGWCQMDVSAVLHFFTGLRKVMVYLVSIVIWFSPIGIFSLIASEIAKTSQPGESTYDFQRN